MAALFFAEMRFDPQDPQHPLNDRFVLSKGHAAPILYAAWAEAGAFDRAELLKLRRDRIGSRRASDAAAAVRRRRDRIARPGHLRRDRHRAQRPPDQIRLPHLLPARRRRVGRRLGLGSRQHRRNRRPRQPVRHHRRQRARAEPRRRCGGTIWSSSRAAGARSAGTRSSIDGHDMNAILDASPKRASTKGRPTMILARTLKGKGVSFAEGKDGWHGRPFKKGEELDRALAELEKQFVADAGRRRSASGRFRSRRAPGRRRRRRSRSRRPPTSSASRSRRARPTATAIAKLGEADPRVVALDADVKNSTFSEKFEKASPGSLLPELHRRAGDDRRRDGPGRARRDSVSVDVRLLPHARRRFHPHGGDQQRRT